MMNEMDKVSALLEVIVKNSSPSFPISGMERILTLKGYLEN